MIDIPSYKNELVFFGSSVLKLYDCDRPNPETESSVRILNHWIENINEFDFSNQDLHFLSKQYDVRGTVCKLYDFEFKRVGEECLEKNLMQVFAGFLFLRTLLANEELEKIDKIVKYINVCWKVFDNMNLPDFMQKAPKKLLMLQNEVFQQLHNNKQDKEIIPPFKNFRSTAKINDAFKILPIDVLFYENPIGRAYLEMLYSLGLKPRRLIHIIPERDIVTKKKVGKLLPSTFRQKYVHSLQTSKILFWPKHLLKNYTDNCNALFEVIMGTYDINNSCIHGLTKLKPLEQFSDEVVRVFYDSFRDKRFVDTVKKTPSQFILYTGGGIIPKEVFDISNRKLLHIHPGYLPNIRGADCFYLSSMLTGRPSATCFIMNAGIDTGDIINAKFLQKLDLSGCIHGLSEKMIYRLIYSFVDPWVRAVVLRDTLLSTDNFSCVTVYIKSC